MKKTWSISPSRLHPPLWAEVERFGVCFRLRTLIFDLARSLRCGVENVLLELHFVIPALGMVLEEAWFLMAEGFNQLKKQTLLTRAQTRLWLTLAFFILLALTF